MPETQDILPDLDSLDSTALKALIRFQQGLIVSSRTEIENLKLLIAKLRRMQFGTRSEKLDRHIEQLELRLEDLDRGRRYGHAARLHRSQRACANRSQPKSFYRTHLRFSRQTRRPDQGALV